MPKPVVSDIFATGFLMHRENMDSLKEFKYWCQDAFSFLTQYGFSEQTLPKEKFQNPYQVIYSKNKIKIQILGEGYGAMASICFIASNGEAVPYGLLSENNKERNKKGKPASQKDQIYAGAKLIEENLQNLLKGDYSLVNQLGNHFAEQEVKFKKGLEAFLNNPVAMAERAVKVAVSEAGHSFKKGDYKKVVQLLSPHLKYLTLKEIQRLDIAKSKLKS